MSVECIEMKGINNDYLKAIAKIKINDFGLIINDVKLFKKNSKYWVGMPDKEYKKDGERKYFKIIQFVDKEQEKKLMQEIQDCLLKTLEMGIQADRDNRYGQELSFEGFI